MFSNICRHRFNLLQEHTSQWKYPTEIKRQTSVCVYVRACACMCVYVRACVCVNADKGSVEVFAVFFDAEGQS